MGAGVSTEGAPLTRVKCKNKLGVLFDPEAEEKFYATATGPKGEETVPWPEAAAYVKTRDERWRDPKHVLFQNLKQFKVARVEIEKIANEKIKGTIREIPQRGQDVGDECQQRGLDGKPAASLDALYEIAAMAREVYANVMNDVCTGGPPLNLAPLKGRARAEAKSQNEYADKTAPCYSWLFDIVRGSVYCDHEDELVALWKKIEADSRIEIVRTENRFNPPLFNGYRDIMMNVAVDVDTPTGTVSHLCELQIHLTAIKNSEPMHKSHLVYEFFRDFFLGNAEAVEQRLDMFCALPVSDVENTDELVDVVLRSEELRPNLLFGLCKLLTSIQEFAGVVKVQEGLLRYVKCEYGEESKEAGAALGELGNAYFDLGDYAKARDAFERALPIIEREYGKDSTKMGNVLNSLGNAHGSLGDPAKQRDLQERALAINERAYGRDHTEVALTLGNLGIAYGKLGDHAKERDVLERTLVINEREYGRDHPNVALTLTNLGNAYGSLGDHAKERDMLERGLTIFEHEHGKESTRVAVVLGNLGIAYYSLGDYAKARDMLERALAINEREYGRDHPKVATTLGNLGTAYGSLGDNAKKRDMLERALAILERVYGSDHAQVAITMNGLLTAYNSLGDWAKARDMLERELAIKERAYGKDSTQVAATLTNLGLAHMQLGDSAKARDVLKESLRADLAVQNEDWTRSRKPIDLAVTLLYLGMVDVNVDNAVARANLEQASSIFEGEYGPDHDKSRMCRDILDALNPDAQ